MSPVERAQALAMREAAPIALSGGSISRVYRVDDRVVKVLPGAPPDFFAAEARGLGRLAAAGAPVPEVVSVHDDGIVLTWHAPGPPDWPALGRAVARLHLVTAPTYGESRPLFLGRFRFEAGTTDDATAFLVDLRLRPLLAACRRTLGSARADRVARYLDGIRLEPEGPREVHGDLWSGNVLHSDRPLLVDPSAQGAERAYDLSMMELFGGFPAPFWHAYASIAPVSPPVRAAIDAHQLVFVLVHVAMFGTGYCGAVDRIVDGGAS